MTEPDQHSSPIKTPKQLIIVVALAFIVPIVIIGLLSQLLTSTPHDTSGDEQRVLERIKPVGSIVIADVSVPRGNLTGEQVYGQVCKTCHDAGLAGAPKSGDKGSMDGADRGGREDARPTRRRRLSGQGGRDAAKGGNTDLTDDEVHRAVVYLANRWAPVGKNLRQPPLQRRRPQSRRPLRCPLQSPAHRLRPRRRLQQRPQQRRAHPQPRHP
jgi:cytochrome c5